MSSPEVICPGCRMSRLRIENWRGDFGEMPPGTPIRIELVCPRCHNEYILQATLTEVANAST